MYVTGGPVSGEGERQRSETADRHGRKFSQPHCCQKENRVSSWRKIMTKEVGSTLRGRLEDTVADRTVHAKMRGGAQSRRAPPSRGGTVYSTRLYWSFHPIFIAAGLPALPGVPAPRAAGISHPEKHGAQIIHGNIAPWAARAAPPHSRAANRAKRKPIFTFPARTCSVKTASRVDSQGT